jgi:tRNA A-37 threonylcarbamoyl transferase component Bud32
MLAYQDLSALPVDWPDLQLVQRRQRKETLREVYLDGERRVFKRYILDAGAVLYPRPWAMEARALIRAAGLAVPRFVATYAGRGKDGRRQFVLQRTYIRGRSIERVDNAVVEAMAELLAGLHRRGVVTRDATIDNFVQRPDQTMCFIDFGKARIHRLPAYYDIGSELARFFHGTLFYDETLWRRFCRRYEQVRRTGPAARAVERFFFRFCKKSRMRRRGIRP